MDLAVLASGPAAAVASEAGLGLPGFARLGRGFAHHYGHMFILRPGVLKGWRR